MAIVGVNTRTPVTALPEQPDVNQGFPASVIISETLVGQPGATPVLISGPSYDVYPRQLPGGSWTFAGALPPQITKL